jgi:glycosyltransferase involved in cell wall biosynthesis
MTPLILAHDYLIQMGGAERVVAAMARHHPEAPIYTSAIDPNRLLPEFTLDRLHTSWMQRLPGMPAAFKQYFPLYPSAFRSFGPVDCGVAWISASTFSKCLRLVPTAVSVCYCHNPTRFLWQTEDYVKGEIRSRPVNRLARLTFPWLRVTDRQAAQNMDILIANSQDVRLRIQQHYGREARIIHPPVEVTRFQVSEVSRDYYLIVSRLVAYKRMDVAVEAFNKLGKRLVIVGEGPDRARLESLAAPNIKFAGRATDPQVHELMTHCRALIFPGDEDFGIAPVEAQACGKPVIAWARGGALETVKAGETGWFFSECTPGALADAVERAEKIVWRPQFIRRWAETFGEDRFLKAMDAVLDEARAEHRARLLRKAARKSSRKDPEFGSGTPFSPHQREGVDARDAGP